MTVEVSNLLRALELEPIGEHRYRAPGQTGGRGVIFGGQLIGQAIAAASREAAGKEVLSVHAIFARGARSEDDLQVDVDTMHAGGTFGSSTVTMWQGDRLCARALVLLHRPEPDMIRHTASMPEVGGPDDAVARETVEGIGEVRVAGGVDAMSGDTVGPPEQYHWVRFTGAPDDTVAKQALVAFATNGPFIGTAMLPHAGVGLAAAHGEFSTGVLAHRVTFHDPYEAGEWLLLAFEAPVAGRGRVYGRGQVFTQDGRLIASVAQDSMIRAFPEGQSPAGREGTVL